jgi:hypothetical protein
MAPRRTRIDTQPAVWRPLVMLPILTDVTMRFLRLWLDHWRDRPLVLPLAAVGGRCGGAAERRAHPVHVGAATDAIRHSSTGRGRTQVRATHGVLGRAQLVASRSLWPDGDLADRWQPTHRNDRTAPSPAHATNATYVPGCASGSMPTRPCPRKHPHAADPSCPSLARLSWSVVLGFK